MVRRTVSSDSQTETFEPGALLLEVVICTYNRSALLATALDAFVGQTAHADDRWAVMVVDNNCTDDTQKVVAGFQNRIANLRVVEEGQQGLTPARVRGVRSTVAPWIVFVDDDCVVAKDWVEQALDFVTRHPEASAFNGRNLLTLETECPMPWITPQMFAAADSGGSIERESSTNLHGAGLGLRRDAVISSGWLDRQAATDRTGKSLRSGGDSEISVRVEAAGGPTWFVPQCQISHIVDASRLRFGYLMRLNFRLAESGPFTRAMQFDHLWAWHRHHVSALVAGAKRHSRRLHKPVGTSGEVTKSIGSVTPEAGLRGRLLALSRGAGFVWGYLKLAVQPKRVKRDLLGLAVSRAR